MEEHGLATKERMYQFGATYALTLCKLVQFYTYIFALVCVGINHQKGGD
jgi:hypothetical protein